jgi:hypothetical protein
VRRRPPVKAEEREDAHFRGNPTQVADRCDMKCLP